LPLAKNARGRLSHIRLAVAASLLAIETLKWIELLCIDMEGDIPNCTGCGKSGYYGVCDDCRQPDHEIEPINRNARKPSHNDTNHGYKEWLP
jgi:hypothetical protein